MIIQNGATLEFAYASDLTRRAFLDGALLTDEQTAQVIEAAEAYRHEVSGAVRHEDGHEYLHRKDAAHYLHCDHPEHPGNWSDELATEDQIERAMEHVGQYIETAMWSSYVFTTEGAEDDGRSCDEYELSDSARETLEQSYREAVTGLPLNLATHVDDADRWSQFAHDLWLNREHHGAGFWDGDWSEPFATELDSYADSLGEGAQEWYLNDDHELEVSV